MNNERLAALIGEGGNDELIPVLWEKMRKFYRLQADKWAARFPEQCAQYGITAADLQQEGYLSMLEAIKAYSRKAEETEAAFITFCGYQFTNRCAALTGIRAGHRSDALNRCFISLNEPLEDKDGDTDTERGELIPDPDAGKPFEDLERRDYAESIRAVMCAALTDDRERETLVQFFFEGKTLKSIAEREGVTLERIRQIKNRAIHHLHRGKALQALKALDYYQHVGVAAAQRDGSIVERIAERRERILTA